jgi:C-terminal processing protease CtpA/Prc
LVAFAFAFPGTCPTWDLIAADGDAIESDGVAPDITVAPAADALAIGVDLPLRTAIDNVRTRIGP